MCKDHGVSLCFAGESVEQVVQVTDSVFLQLSSYSLEELGIAKPDSVSWKDAQGFHFQLLAYTLLGVYDIACSHFAESLTDPDFSATAATYIVHIIDCHRRVQEWLSQASRTKRLKGMLSSCMYFFCVYVRTPQHEAGACEATCQCGRCTCATQLLLQRSNFLSIVSQG